jgi:hypothetical protein
LFIREKIIKKKTLKNQSTEWLFFSLFALFSLSDVQVTQLLLAVRRMDPSLMYANVSVCKKKGDSVAGC